MNTSNITNYKPKDFAIISNGVTKKNINKTERIRKLDRQNIQKQVLKVQKLHHRIDNIRTDYVNKCVNEIVKTKPSYITIEDLNVKGMMKNRHRSKAVTSQKFYEFRTKLEAKCKELGIELRIVDRWYPSSKLCHECDCRHVPMALVGNLRLWTVQELVSSVLLVIAKAYRMKQ